MNTQFERISIGPGLDDSELERYEYIARGGSLKIFIRAWNEELLGISFYEVQYFIDCGFHYTKDFCRAIGETPLLAKVLKLDYEEGKMSQDHSYQYFRFYDIDDNPGLEIICKEMSLDS